MRFQITFFTAILIFSVFLTACPSPEAPNANTNPVNSNAPKNTSNGNLNPTKSPEAATTNNAPTITPVVKAYYEALKKKDDAALKKVMTQEFINALEADMKAEGGKSLAAYAAELEDLKATIEVRNEKIDGDKAVAELKGGTYVNWTPFEFARENGEWKFTGKSPDVKSVKESVTNSNAAK
ncbi:MAG TPA: hypothetical protein VGC76_03295 [Pyrinomonadaceae bacterium]|jgi:hypothetical protein